MAAIVGNGEYRYRIVEDWAKLPDGWSFKEVAAVGVDRNDNVYVFSRGEHPMMVFDRDGNFLRSWGEGQYPRAHGVHMGPDDSIYLTDDGGHFVRKCRIEDGKVLLELGVPGTAGALYERRAVPPLHPHGAVARRATSTSRTATATPASTNTRRTANCCSRGASPAPIRASSTSSTTSAPTPTAGSMSPTAKTTASRCSTATASTRRSGTICIARAASICRTATIRSAISANSGRAWRSTATARISGRGSASSITRASCCRASATRMPARRRPRSSGRTGSPPIRAAISMSARSAGRCGRGLFPGQPHPPNLRALQKYERIH